MTRDLRARAARVSPRRLPRPNLGVDGQRQALDRLDCDRMFLAVFETGGFSRAAARLKTSAGQASKLVTKLEGELGVQLFNRTTRALSPTEVGRAYLRAAEGPD